MEIIKRPFPSSTSDGFTAYILKNTIGASVEILDFGGIIRSLRVPDKNGRMGDIVLGQDSIDDYKSNNSCTGAILGRCANRIAGAEYSVNGIVISLARNLGPHSIHGGPSGYSGRKFNVESHIFEDKAVLVLHILDEGFGGFPGTVDFTVRYSFSESCELDIQYDAIPDKDTVLNPSHHCYFNLAGHDSGSIAAHILKFNSEYYTPNDSDCMPSGEVRFVKGTAFDFLGPREIGQGLESNDQQIQLSKGYDHNFCLKGRGYRLGAEVYEAGSGRSLHMYTDMPGVQFFTSNSMPDIPCKDGVVYGDHQGISLETQYFPNSANLSHFPSPITKGNERFLSRTTFVFGVKDEI